jgi:C1A family cysteine protease
MATIETNEAEAVGMAVEQAIVEHVLPAIQARPAPADGEPLGMGWLRDQPDFRDYTGEHDSVLPQLKKIGVAKPEALTLAAKVDLRAYCSPVENQFSLGSCTANAVVGLVEYFERRAHNRHIDASRLFLYKATRDLLHSTGDTGAYLRSTMGALALFGVPPEEYWPYDITKFDDEPTAFCYAFGADFRAISYYRLDPPGTTPSALLQKIRANLAAGLPSVFGFTVYSSYSQASGTGKLPYPSAGEKVAGGHAVLAIGYDDNATITNTNTGASTKGALVFRNSWGTGWGDGGYGMLPYDYVTHRLAVDFWSLTNQVWTDTGAFKA